MKKAIAGTFVTAAAAMTLTGCVANSPYAALSPSDNAAAYAPAPVVDPRYAAQYSQPDGPRHNVQYQGQLPQPQQKFPLCPSDFPGFCIPGQEANYNSTYNVVVRGPHGSQSLELWKPGTQEWSIGNLGAPSSKGNFLSSNHGLEYYQLNTDAKVQAAIRYFPPQAAQALLDRANLDKADAQYGAPQRMCVDNYGRQAVCPPNVKPPNPY